MPVSISRRDALGEQATMNHLTSYQITISGEPNIENPESSIQHLTFSQLKRNTAKCFCGRAKRFYRSVLRENLVSENTSLTKINPVILSDYFVSLRLRGEKQS